jgi:hypothetical protein
MYEIINLMREIVNMMCKTESLSHETVKSMRDFWVVIG